MPSWLQLDIVDCAGMVAGQWGRRLGEEEGGHWAVCHGRVVQVAICMAWEAMDLASWAPMTRQAILCPRQLGWAFGPVAA